MCEDLKLQIEKFISDIPESRTRRVFQYRYIDNMEWLPIAYRIGKMIKVIQGRWVHLEGLE